MVVLGKSTLRRSLPLGSGEAYSGSQRTFNPAYLATVSNRTLGVWLFILKSIRVGLIGFLAGRLHSLALAQDHLLGAQDFLLGDHGTGVQRVGFLEFEQGVAQLSLRADFGGVGDVGSGGLEAGFLSGNLIDQFARVRGEGLFIGVEGGVPILFLLLGAPLSQELIAFAGLGLQVEGRPDQRARQQDCR